LPTLTPWVIRVIEEQSARTEVKLSFENKLREGKAHIYNGRRDPGTLGKSN